MATTTPLRIPFFSLAIYAVGAWMCFNSLTVYPYGGADLIIVTVLGLCFLLSALMDAPGRRTYREFLAFFGTSCVVAASLFAVLVPKGVAPGEDFADALMLVAGLLWGPSVAAAVFAWQNSRFHRAAAPEETAKTATRREHIQLALIALGLSLFAAIFTLPQTGDAQIASKLASHAFLATIVIVVKSVAVYALVGWCAWLYWQRNLLPAPSAERLLPLRRFTLVAFCCVGLVLSLLTARISLQTYRDSLIVSPGFQY